jgi:tRNA-Thr(GGU) m(6)t(6)A37 methyltransferase TsaA
VENVVNGTLRVVGHVRSPWRTAAEVPVQGAEAVVEVLPGYEAALDGIERSSHLVVLAWLHLADRDVLVSRPRKLDPCAPPCGVFASRSPVRPNPISLCVVRLVRREGLRLVVDPLDLVDGTPVVDLKSYGPGMDGVFSARIRRRIGPWALGDERLPAFLGSELANHLGDAASAPEARVALAAVFVAVRRYGVDARDEALRVTVNRLGVATDALMGLTGATFASGRLAASPGDGPLRFEFRLGDDVLVLEEHPGTRDLLDDPPRWVAEAFEQE